MKLPAVDNEFIFIGQDPHSSSLFGNKYLPVVVVDIGEKKKKQKYCAPTRDEINRDTARLLIALCCQMAEIIVIDSIVIRALYEEIVIVRKSFVFDFVKTEGKIIRQNGMRREKFHFRFHSRFGITFRGNIIGLILQGLFYDGGKLIFHNAVAISMINRVGKDFSGLM